MSLGYTHPWGKRWIFEAGYRWYDQSAADFYSDLFPRADAQNFLARDKELSTFTSQMFSLGATYELPSLGWDRIRRSTVNLFYDRINFQYDDFRDITDRRRAGHRGTLRLRRRRVPPVHLGLVLACAAGDQQRGRNRSALPGACAKNTDGSVISSSRITGAPRSSRIMSMRA